MATVIDSLLIELGLDTSKFDASQKKSVEGLRKLEEQADKTNKKNQKGAKDTADSFDKVTDSLIKLGVTLVSFEGFKSLIVDTTKSNVELGRSASILSMTSKELKTWGQMAEETGGDIESMTSTLKGLQQSLVALKYGGASGELIKSASFLKAWGALDLNTMQVDFYKLSDAIVAFRKTHTEAETVNFAESLGLNQAALLLLEKGSEYLRQDHDAIALLNAGMDENVIKAEKLNNAWLQIKRTFEGIKQALYGKIVDYLFSGSSSFEVSDEAWSNYDKTRKMYEDKKALENGTYVEPKSSKKSSSVPNSQSSKDLMQYFMSQGWSKDQAAGIVGNLIQESSLNPTVENQGHIGLAQWDAHRQAEFKKWAGYGLNDKRADLMKQAQFVQYELTQGEFAKVGKHLKQAAGTTNTSNIIMNEYEKPGDYSGAARAAYASQASMLGANVNAPPAAGKNITSSVNIQNQVINTKATDANGIAKDMHTALQQNTLINAGIMGAD